MEAILVALQALVAAMEHLPSVAISPLVNLLWEGHNKMCTEMARLRAEIGDKSARCDSLDIALRQALLEVDSLKNSPVVPLGVFSAQLKVPLWFLRENKIGCIRLLRAATGIGLREAKEETERLQEMNIHSSELDTLVFLCRISQENMLSFLRDISFWTKMPHFSLVWS